MNKKKILSLIMALVMLVGVFSPLSAFADNANTPEETTKVTLHKIVMDKTTFTNFTKGTKSKDGDVEYDGNKITNVKDFFAGKNAGANAIAKEADGVYFAWAKKDTDNKYYWIAQDGSFIEPKVEANETNLDKVPDTAFGGRTENGAGKEFTTTGFAGEYKIFEIHEKSSYVGDKNEALTDMKAVPVEITLPLVNNDGVVTDAHVYPKNTEDKPQIDKNFLKNNELTEAEKEAADKLKVGADYNNYQAKKATAKAEIGKKIPYEVKTEIPAKSKLKEAHWDDIMTEGLTYNQDLKVTIGGNEITPTKDELVQTDKGFSLRLQGDNLALLNGKDAPVTVELKYSATVNSKAIVDIPEANDITFHYGNTPSKGNTPKPTKPNDNGEVTVVKTWGGKDSDWAEGEYAKFKLVDANTGEDVKAADLDAVDGYTFESVVTLEKGGKTSYTWKGLKKDKQYKVVEVESKTLSDAEYTKAENGTIEVTNHKSNNPKPLNPTEPKVVNGGKKFVKTDQEGNRLEGAEFYVKNAAGEYLVAKADDNNEAVKNAKATLTEKQKAYEGLDAEAQKGEEGKAAKKAFDDAQQAYNEAVLNNANKYEFSDSSDNAVVLRSDKDGKFEITGLAYGDYKLEEKTPPTGFAKLNGPVDFKVEKGSYSTVAVDFKYNEGDKENSAKQIINKKVSIPQTGGIGTVIFTVVGISLMAGAVMAMKKNREEA